MTHLAAKLGFVHRTLWQRNPLYRWAALLGPPPLIGCGVAVLAWAAFQQWAPLTAIPDGNIPWAHWTRPIQQAGQPFAEAPIGPVPPTDASGRVSGFQTGWVVIIQPMHLDAMLEASAIQPIIGHFTIDQPLIGLAPILDAEPPTGLFIGGVKAFFPVRTAGVYAFSARFVRSSPQSADCLLWMNSNTHRMIRSTTVNMTGSSVLNFAPTEFRLEPGMHLLEVDVGCWRGDHMVGPGEVTVLVRPPSETALRPVSPDEVIKPILHASNAAGR